MPPSQGFDINTTYPVKNCFWNNFKKNLLPPQLVSRGRSRILVPLLLTINLQQKGKIKKKIFYLFKIQKITVGTRRPFAKSIEVKLKYPLHIPVDKNMVAWFIFWLLLISVLLKPKNNSTKRPLVIQWATVPQLKLNKISLNFKKYCTVYISWCEICEINSLVESAHLFWILFLIE